MKLPKNMTKLLLILAFIVIIATFLSRLLTSSETLSDYADKHPELAYAQAETEESTWEENSSEAADTTDISDSTSDLQENTDISNDQITVNSFTDEYENTDSRITLAEGFFYEPIPVAVQERITGISYPEDAAVSLDELCYMNVSYYDFNDEIQTGELICNTAIADDLLEIFQDLYKAGYHIEKIKLIDEYQGDDHLSMLDNNTSCFNYRVVDGTTKLSKHAYGLAIDINPYYNPYVTYENGAEVVSPEGSEPYADRAGNFPYKIDENDLCYKLFKAHGFTWGGEWNSCKDYQHFQKNE